MKKGAQFKTNKGKFVSSIPIQNINLDLGNPNSYLNAENVSKIYEAHGIQSATKNSSVNNNPKLKIDGTIYRGTIMIKPNSAIPHQSNQITNENIQINNNPQKPTTSMYANETMNSINLEGIKTMNTNLNSISYSYEINKNQKPALKIPKIKINNFKSNSRKEAKKISNSEIQNEMSKKFVGHKEIDNFLRFIGLHKYKELFFKYGIEDLHTLTNLKEEHFNILEIPLGHKLKILKRIKTLCEENPSLISTQLAPNTNQINNHNEIKSGEININNVSSKNELESKPGLIINNYEKNKQEEDTKEGSDNNERNSITILNQFDNENIKEIRNDENKIEVNNQEIKKQNQFNSVAGQNISENNQENFPIKQENRNCGKPLDSEKGTISKINTSIFLKENKNSEIIPKDSNSERINNERIQNEIPKIREKREENIGFTGEGIIEEKQSCWHCFKIFDSKKGFKPLNGKCKYCNEECYQKYFLLNSVICVKCSKKILKSESERREGEYYCSLTCLNGSST